MSSRSRGWLYGPGVNRILGICCLIAVSYTAADILSKHTELQQTASFHLGGPGLLSPLVLLPIVFVAQMFLMIAMILHAFRHPTWNAALKTFAILASCISFVAGGLYLFSYRPMANALSRRSYEPQGAIHANPGSIEEPGA